MDFSSIPAEMMIPIFKKMKTETLVRTRKTAKSADQLVESYRHEIASSLDVDVTLMIRTSRPKIFPEEPTGSFYILRGQTHKEIEDPLRSLSAVMFSKVVVFPLEDHISEDICKLPLFPVLSKLKLLTDNLEVTQLSTNFVLQLAGIIRSRRLSVHKIRENDSGTELVGNDVVRSRRYVTLDSCWGDHDLCPPELVDRFTHLPSIRLSGIRLPFLGSMIDILRQKTDLGSLRYVYMPSPARFFLNPRIPHPPSHMLCLCSDLSAVSHLVEGVHKWLVCFETIRGRQHHKEPMLIVIVEKCPYQLLKVLTVHTLGRNTDIAPVRDAFVNAQDMISRFMIFQSFFNKMRLNAKLSMSQ